jgi:hypothetical protein
MGDAASEDRERDHCGASPVLGHDRGVRELDALRRPGRARRVDQCQNVIRLDGAPRSVEVEPDFTCGFEVGERDSALDLAVDDDHMLDQRSLCRADDVEELALADDDPVVGVGEQVADLIGRGGVVNRERRRAEVHRGGVHEIELRPVSHHQCDRVTTVDTQRGQPAGDPPDPLGVLGPADLDAAAAGRPERDRLRPLSRCDLESPTKRGGLERPGKRAGAHARLTERLILADLRHRASFPFVDYANLGIRLLGFRVGGSGATVPDGMFPRRGAFRGVGGVGGRAGASAWFSAAANWNSVGSGRWHRS